jgi:tetratricopeptide (TPR) repeat protein
MARWWPLLLVAACVPQGTRYGLTKHPWWEAQSAHFVVRTNIGKENVPELSRRLEEMWSALALQYERMVPARAAADRMRVIHLERCSDVHVFADAGGITSRSRDYLNQTILVTCDDAWAPEGREALVHELTHAFNRRFLGAMPTWLNEGLAEYYSTIAIEDGKVVVGKLRVRDGRMWGVVRRAPRLDELIRQRWPEIEDRYTPHLAYFAARNLVHLLSNGPDDYRARFRRYLTLGANGLPWDDAWNLAFRDLAPDRLAADYRDYTFRELHLVRDAHQVVAPPAPEVLALRPGEVHATWIQLLLVGRYTAEAAPYHLQEAEREDPSWPDLAFRKGRLAHRNGQLEEAADLFRRHLVKQPDDRRALNGLVLVELERLTKDRNGLEPAPPPGIEALLDDVKALARSASAPEELNLVAWYFALARKPEVGLNFARRALALKPSCADCLDSLALSLHQVGRDEEAVEVQERAVRLYSGGSAPARKRLEAYRQAAGR